MLKTLRRGNLLLAFLLELAMLAAAFSLAAAAFTGFGFGAATFFAAAFGLADFFGAAAVTAAIALSQYSLARPSGRPSCSQK